MLKLMIADTSPELCNKIRDALEDDYEILCCSDGERLPEQLYSFRPDILVLDLMIPGRDGISVLRAAYVAGIRPHVLAVSSFSTGYVSQALQGLDVCFLMVKPLKLDEVLHRIEDMRMQMESIDDKSLALDRDIHAALLSLNFIRGKGSYKYVVSCLRAMCEHGRPLPMKELYASLIETYGGTDTKYEKAIRDSIQKAWSKRSEAAWRLYFPVGVDGRVACPKITTFLLQVYAMLMDSPTHHGPRRKAE